MSAKYIFVTGGVVSSLGKGWPPPRSAACWRAAACASTCMKFDPYLNVDPGTMSPFQHGEVFVTDDGAETDLDLGHYERFTHAKRPATTTHHRPHLRADHRQGAPRRLSRQDRAGHSARHQRDQSRDEESGAGCRCRHRRDRRHRRRHRVAAVPGSHPPDAPGTRPRAHALRPRHPGPLHRRSAGAQDQAHPALRQRAAKHRNPAGHPALPHRPLPFPEIKSRSPSSATSKKRRHHRPRRRQHLRVPAWPSRTKASTRSSSNICTSTPKTADLKQVGGLVHRAYNPKDEVTSASSASTSSTKTQLQVAQGSSRPRRAGAQSQAQASHWIEAEGLESGQDEPR
jgi:hypothetical protein